VRPDEETAFRLSRAVREVKALVDEALLDPGFGCRCALEQTLAARASLCFEKPATGMFYCNRFCGRAAPAERILTQDAPREVCVNLPQPTG